MMHKSQIFGFPSYKLNQRVENILYLYNFVIRLNQRIMSQSKLINNVVNDITTIRNHPFYQDWDDWRQVCLAYHSEEIKKLQLAINRGYRKYLSSDFNSYDAWLIDDIYYKTCEFHDLLNQYGLHGLKENMKGWQSSAFRIGLCDCDDIHSDCYVFKWPKINCKQRLIHAKAYILSIMWAYVGWCKPSRYLRKYYRRLERVILSLGDHLFDFDFELIFNPPAYSGRGRMLLRELYVRGFLDKVDLNSIMYGCESLKHVRQQSGSNQSQGADCYDSMINLYSKLINKFDNKMLKDAVVVREQSLFSISHKHEHLWSDVDFKKLKSTISNAQSSFLSGMSETIMGTARNLTVLFISASTVALLAKVAIGVSADIIFKLLHFIYSFICGDYFRDRIDNSEIVMQQSFKNEELSIPFIPAMILEYIISPPKNILASIWSSRNTDLVMRRIGYLGDIKVERGLERIIDWMKSVLKQVQNWYRCEILGLEVQPDLDNVNHEILRWNEQVDDVLRTYYDGTFVWSETTWSVIYNLYSQGLKFTRSTAYIKWKQDVWKVVSKLGNILELFKTHQRSGTSIRNPPVTIYLTGDTGVGKSSLTYPLAAEILQEIFKEEESPVDLEKHWQSLIYMRSAEQEFWDGYENQLVTVFDDFSQQMDSVASPNLELFEIIRASNCFPYPLHMAALDQKANTTFSSKIVLVSSNLPKPETHSLSFPSALYNRFEICVKVRRANKGNERHGTTFDPMAYQFTQYNMLTGEDIGEITYDDLIKLSTEAYYRRRTYVDSIHQYITSRLSRPVEQSGFVVSDTGDVVSVNSINYKIPFSWRMNYYKDKILSYIYKDPWTSLKEVVGSLKFKYQELQNSWNNFKVKHSYLSKIAMMTTLLLTGLVFLKIFTKIKRMIQPEVVSMMTPEAFAEGYSNPKIQVAKKESYTPVQARVAVRESIKSVEKEVASEQGVKDLNAAEVLMKVARHNLYKMYESTANTPIGHVMFIRGKIALMPRHYISSLKQALKNDSDATVWFEAVVLKRSFECRIDELLKTVKTFQSPDESKGPVYTRDLMAVIVSTAITHTDALPYFVKRADVNRVDVTSVMLPVLTTNGLKNSDRAILMLRFSEGKSQLRRETNLPVYNDDVELVRYVRDVWSYNMDTQSTECGAPLIVRNSMIRPGKICGIHIAGIEGTGQGFSTPVYQEDVCDILHMFPVESKFNQVFTLDVSEFPLEQGQVPKDAEFIRLGLIKNPLPQPGKTQVVPSLAYASYKQPETKPCTLYKTKVDGEDFNPRTYRLERLGNIPIPLRQDMIINSSNAFLDEISQVISKSDDINNVNIKSIYTFNEAVKGIEGELYVNAVKRDTSPGFPFVQMLGYKDRKKFFGTKDEYDLTSPQCNVLKARVDKIIESAKNGEILDHYFIDTLKDERKPIHKAHKTRLFAAGPLDYLIACKMYFNGVVALLQKNRNWSHVSVGTNPYSLDWGEIVRTLHQKATNVIAGDFEGFDASQHQMLLEASGEVLIQLSVRFLKSTPEDVQVMRALLVSLFNSLHITGSEVYQWTHSLPSGHYLTAIINSIFVNVAFGCIWQVCFKRFSYMCARSFWERCGIVAYGDDHLVSVPEVDLDKFNQYTVTEFFKSIGLSYTMEDKDSVVEAGSRTIDNVSYLKRKFVFDKDLNQWLSPLSLSSVLETPMWIHRCPDPVAQTIANLEFSLKELSLHDDNIWKKWAPKLQQECEKLGHYTVFRDKEETRLICLDQALTM
jgi:hypothetical protein